MNNLQSLFCLCSKGHEMILIVELADGKQQMLALAESQTLTVLNGAESKNTLYRY
ncbi:hypothetical protein [Psychromonas sp. MB-3u-54]|uniref:hypothetical protein n=1 Tax=Psychromonas sp. MB-3u-54 TaxID=2058319 RepID=UPI0012FE86FF|nr:hypothetical protein [Psychromonas sp. MB-3u-54]